MSPSITIITVVFNGEQHLENTILSVINQSYPNIEYIIIDGGSSDGTIDIIRKYEHLISYWKSEKDFGIYDAMNKALKFATGELVNFMNAGDLFSNSNSVANFAKFFDPAISIIYSNIKLISENLKFEEIDQDQFRKYCFYRNICHQSIFYNVNKLRNLLYFDLRYKISSDFDLLLRIYLHDRINFAKKSNEFDVKYLDGGLSSIYCLERIDERKSILKERLKLMSTDYLLNIIKTKYNKLQCKKYIRNG